MYESFSFSGESEMCYGLEIVKQVLKTHNIDVLPMDFKTKKPVLVSLYWPEQIFDFIKWRYSNPAMKDKPVIIGGNYPTTSPSAVLPFADNVYMGDGELWDGSLDSPYMASKKGARVRAFAATLIPAPYEDTQYNRRTFSEISRGCKNKCLFCQYGWLKPYREIDLVDIQQIIKKAKTKSIRVFAADRFQHRAYTRIRETLESLGKCDTGSDVSLKFVLKNPEYLKYTKKVRTGIEGMSERLRFMVGKKYTDNDIVNFCKLVVANGIKCLDFYMIYGLPTEGKEDALQFEQLIKRLDIELPEGYTIAIHWNAFTPSAQTPFQWCAPSAGGCDYMTEMFARNPNKRIKIYHKPKLTGRWTIMRRMLAIRSDESTKDLVYNFALKESQFKKNPNFLLSEYKKRTGIDLMGEWPEETPLPWDRYCTYKKDSMLKLKKAMVKKYERTKAETN